MCIRDSLGLVLVLASMGIGWRVIGKGRTEPAAIDEPQAATISRFGASPNPTASVPIIEVGSTAPPLPSSAGAVLGTTPVTRPPRPDSAANGAKPSLRAPDTIRRTNPYR